MGASDWKCKYGDCRRWAHQVHHSNLRKVRRLRYHHRVHSNLLKVRRSRYFHRVASWSRRWLRLALLWQCTRTCTQGVAHTTHTRTHVLNIALLYRFFYNLSFRLTWPPYQSSYVQEGMEFYKSSMVVIALFMLEPRHLACVSPAPFSLRPRWSVGSMFTWSIPMI